MMLSRFCKQMLSVRINFPFIYCFMPSKNGAGVLRDQQFSLVCVFGPLLPSDCFFGGGGSSDNPFGLMLNSCQPIAEISHYTKWSETQRNDPKIERINPQRNKKQISSCSAASKQSVGHFGHQE